MLSDEEKQAIEYLEARLYGNEGCKFIDVAESDLRIFLNIVENLQKDIANWKKYCDEQEADITVKDNQICDLEFKIDNQQKEIEELKENYIRLQNTEAIQDIYIKKDKIKAILEEYKYTEIGDSEKIIEFYKKMQSLLGKE